MVLSTVIPDELTIPFDKRLDTDWPVARAIHAKDVVERPVLADQHDDVLDRCRGSAAASVVVIVVGHDGTDCRDSKQRATKSRRQQQQTVSIVTVSRHRPPPLLSNGGRLDTQRDSRFAFLFLLNIAICHEGFTALFKIVAYNIIRLRRAPRIFCRANALRTTGVIGERPRGDAQGESEIRNIQMLLAQQVHILNALPGFRNSTQRSG